MDTAGEEVRRLTGSSPPGPRGRTSSRRVWAHPGQNPNMAAYAHRHGEDLDQDEDQDLVPVPRLRGRPAQVDRPLSRLRGVGHARCLPRAGRGCHGRHGGRHRAPGRCRGGRRLGGQSGGAAGGCGPAGGPAPLERGGRTRPSAGGRFRARFGDPAGWRARHRQEHASPADRGRGRGRRRLHPLCKQRGEPRADPAAGGPTGGGGPRLPPGSPPLYGHQPGSHRGRDPAGQAPS